jgi:cobalt-precorrin 5A hydrolase/precorrin-3B C17-methyltransferase
LSQLLQGGVVDQLVGSGASPSASETLANAWPHSAGFVVVGATGLVTRLIAPLLQDKRRDPAVVVVDPLGRFAIPLLGGHGAGAEALSQRVAALLGGTAVLSGASSGSGRLALDAFGSWWGWRRGGGDWDALMRHGAARGGRLPVRQEAGSRLWRQLQAAAPHGEGSEGDQDNPIPSAPVTTQLPTSTPLPTGAPLPTATPLPTGAPEPATISATEHRELLVTAGEGPGCRWHPPCLWLGIGCERGTDLALLERLVMEGLAAAQLAAAAVAGLASIDRKGDEPALLELAARRGWPLRLFRAEQLAEVSVPNPSAAVAAEMGTASVAEAAALLAAGTGAQLLLPKQIKRRQAGENGAATLAICQALEQWAPQRGQLHLVGSGPGRLDLLTPAARQALAASSTWVGYGLYLDLLEPLRRPDQLRLDGRLTEERARCQEALALACQGLPVALVSSGDSGIYAMAGLALELWLQLPANARPGFAVHPGISALQLAAARAGAPLMHDFCTISLSDRLTPWEVIERRLRAAAAGDFVVALYNPRSRDRHWQLQRACELLLEGRPASTPVAIARQLGRSEEAVSLHRLGSLPIEQVDMLTLVLVGNSSSYLKDGKMVTPRGYPGAELA